MSDLQSQPDEIDSLIASVNEPAAPRAMSAPEGEAPAAPETAAPPAQVQQPPMVEHEFTWNGQKIKAPQEMILSKYAPMGYDYAQKMAAFKEQQKMREQEWKERDKKYERYEVIDKYAIENQDWWKHVQDQYENRLASEDPTVKHVKNILQEKLKPFEEKLAAEERAAQETKIKQEDASLAEDIKSIRAKYQDLDFDTPDADGKSLEYKILEHGSRHNFPTFKSAFLDFHHEQLEKMWESRGREAVSKDAQKRTKLGLSPVTATPKKTEGYDVKGKNYNQILDDVFAKEGIT